MRSGRPGVPKALTAMAMGVLAGLLLPALVCAQALDRDVLARCVRASVRLETVSPDGWSSYGSGTVIDPRGYILTNFHVVGALEPSEGVRPGDPINPDNETMVAFTTSSRAPARFRYRARVVRANRLLDLALLRIVADAEGNPVQPSELPAIPIADSREIEPSDRVFAVGYPLGMETISVTSGSVVGFVPMLDGTTSAWVRTDARFNPGNSGGTLVDLQGRLVGIPTLVVTGHHGQRLLEPIELARPTERVPAAWLASLRAGQIDDVLIEGLPALRADRPVTIPLTGEVGIGEEMAFFVRIESDRAGIVRGPEGVDLTFVGPEGGDELSGTGTLSIGPNVGLGTLRVVVERPAQRGSLTLRFAPDPTVTVAPQPPSETVRITGTVLRDGEGAAALVVVAREGVDLAARLRELTARRITQADFDADVVASVRADQDGAFALALRRGSTFPVAFVLRGTRPQVRSLRIGARTAADLTLPPIVPRR